MIVLVGVACCNSSHDSVNTADIVSLVAAGGGDFFKRRTIMAVEHAKN